MKTRIPLFIALFLSATFSFSQDCTRPSTSQLFQPNHIRTYISNTSTLIDNSIQPFGFENIDIKLGTSALFASGIWLGAKDVGGNLLFSGRTYDSDNTISFAPGPYPENGNLDASTCTNFDRFFQVSRTNVELHRADYADNQFLDNPIPDIMGWPGRGNIEFEDVHGFPLPSMTASYAPFYDQNNDGTYNPHDGDYPLPDGVDKNSIPEQLMWCVFNDVIAASPLNVEIQMTVWGFYCEDNDLINNTMFTSHKIINYSGEPRNDMRFGLWHDMDIGCPVDDYVGCAPAQNSFYGYNGSGSDDCICDPFAHYCGRETTLGITFLNKDLASYINFYSNNINPPIGTTAPETAPEYYNALLGRWRDGTPLTVGGNGYNLSSVDFTTFAFPGFPLDPDGWSMLRAFLAAADQKGVAATDMGDFAPGGIYTIDMAYSFHHVEGEDSYRQLEPMLNNIADIQTFYDNQFNVAPCTSLEVCVEDCVWPGDANADGIANYADLLEIGLAYNSQGTDRIGPTNWLPLAADDWTNSFNDGTNFKHADCNGDGMVDNTDFRDVTLPFYGYTHDAYEPASICNEGPELSLLRRLPIGSNLDTIQQGGYYFVELNMNYTEEFYGLSFELEYDTNYVESIEGTASSSSFWMGSDSLEYIDYLLDTEDAPTRNSLDYAMVKTNGNNSKLTRERIIFMRLRIKQDIPSTFTSLTQLKFKNVRAVLSDGTPLNIGGMTTNMIVEDLPTSTKQVSSQIPVTLFPNPTTAQVQISFNGFAAQHIKLMDTQGRLVKTMAAANIERLTLDVSDLPTGIYFMNVVGEEGSGTFRIVKQ